MAKTFSLDDTMAQLSEALGFGAIMDPNDYPSAANDCKKNAKIFVRDPDDSEQLYYKGIILF